MVVHVRISEYASSPIGETPGVTVGGSTAYGDIVNLPALVRATIALATEQGFDHSCAPEQGRLLSVLARGCMGRRIGETTSVHGNIAGVLNDLEERLGQQRQPG